MRQLNSLGQVFLTDPVYIQRIFKSLKIEGGTVLEIGPGRGVLSGLLAEKAASLYCVEVDRRFCNFLRRKFRHRNGVKIIHSDILKFSLPEIGNNTIIFGNVPYQISSRLIKYLVKYRASIQVAYITFQKEFFEKIIAKPSGKGYNFLSCYAQYYLKAERIFDIEAAAFTPVPKVDSTFSRLNFYSRPQYKVRNEDFLFAIIRRAFSSRRKKIANALSLSKDDRDFFESIGLNLNSRPEDLSLGSYVNIADRLYSG